MGDSEDNGSLFNNIVGDMKTTGPLWEDLLVKASKFYSAVKQTALTADAFLDSFQKIADATTNSKGATRDIGVSFTKIVLRHRAIENKLKTYVGILADSFVTPLQDYVDEWKRNGNQLEKDHSKDYKKLKGDLKRASADASKLKKKASKKVGKQEYTDQFRDAMKVANHLSKSLEEQEKTYLRAIMIEERSRAAQFFRCYKPCVEQEITLISEIEQLQSILDETTKQCNTPSQLPAVSEDAITGYKIPESLMPDSRDSSTSSSPPGSPLIVKDRSLTMNVGSTSQKQPLSRSQTLPNSYSKNGLDPMPVSMPVIPSLTKSPSISSRSSYSSSSSLDHPHNAPIYEEPNTDIHGNRDQYAPNLSNENNMIDIHKALKARSSWSSIETSDSSSGIGSHNSLTNKTYSSNQMMQQNYHNSSNDESDSVIEEDYLNGYNVSSYQQHAQPNYQQYQQQQLSSGFHQQHSNNSNNSEQMKYATIDRSHFRRNQIRSSSLRETNSIKQRSNSLGENDDTFPSFPDYKMNLPKTKTHTIAGRTNGNVHQGQRQTVFQVFEGHDPSELLKRLSPTSSPYKKVPPPAPHRRNSSPVAPLTAPKPSRNMIRQISEGGMNPLSFTSDNEPNTAKPGSFEAELQQKRIILNKKRSLSVDHSAMMR